MFNAQVCKIARLDRTRVALESIILCFPKSRKRISTAQISDTKVFSVIRKLIARFGTIATWMVAMRHFCVQTARYLVKWVNNLFKIKFLDQNSLTMWSWSMIIHCVMMWMFCEYYHMKICVFQFRFCWLVTGGLMLNAHRRRSYMYWTKGYISIFCHSARSSQKTIQDHWSISKYWFSHLILKRMDAIYC